MQTIKILLMVIVATGLSACSSGGGDTTAPVITLLGISPVNVTIGGSYSDAGATASDNVDGNITANIAIVNSVNTAVIGPYSVTYTVSDAAGNAAAPVTRTVNVVAATSAVVGAFYSSAPNWNDYVKNDTTTRLNALNIAADGTETGGYSAVIHGGEMRVVDVGVTGCTDQAASDALGAFNWVCDDSSGGARMVSTGLKEGKNLSDLLNFTTPGWLNNSVTITGTGGFTTPTGTWWSNPVVEDNNGMIAGDAVSGTVYIITTNPAANYIIDKNKVALIILPGVTLSGSGNVILGDTMNFFWVEGTIVTTGNGVFLRAVKFSVLRNITVSSGRIGIYNKNSSGNSLSNIITFNNILYGIYMDASTNNSVSNIVAANNGNTGIYLSGFSNNNRLSNIAAYNNSSGIYLQDSSNNNLLNISAASNANEGISVYGFYSDNNILFNITAANNTRSGLLMGNNGTNNNVSNIAIFNNVTTSNTGAKGLHLVVTSNNSLSNVVVANSGDSGIFLSSASNNYFTGLLKVGNNTNGECTVTFSTSPGIVDTTCANEGTSDATLSSGVTLAASFVGKVLSDDTVNSSDTSGTATYATSLDWTSFENTYRGWGIDGSVSPNVDHRGRWTTGTGRIWDWSLANGDTGDASNPVVQNVLTAQLTGNAANTIKHAWLGPALNQADCTALVPGSVFNAVSDCRSTYLRNATEIPDDNVGNDNALCESGETCLFTPNIGAYQGHGALISAGTFVNGDTLTGITLMKYSINGY